MLWWKSNKPRFSILNIMARRYLAIPATFAAIKRVFSISSNIITKNKNQLKPETIKWLTLLKSWKMEDFKDLLEI